MSFNKGMMENTLAQANPVLFINEKEGGVVCMKLNCISSFLSKKCQLQKDQYMSLSLSLSVEHCK